MNADTRTFGLMRSAAPAAAVILCACAPAVAAEQEPGSIGDLGQALAALAIFGVLLLVLGRWAWKPIIEALKRREDDIQQQIDAAAKDKAKAAEQLAACDRKIADADSQAQSILTGARQEAARTREQAVRTAQTEAEQIMTTARHDVEQARADAVRDLQEHTAIIAGQIAKKVLAENLDDAAHQRLIDQSIEVIGRAAEDSS